MWGLSTINLFLYCSLKGKAGKTSHDIQAGGSVYLHYFLDLCPVCHFIFILFFLSSIIELDWVENVALTCNGERFVNQFLDNYNDAIGIPF